MDYFTLPAPHGTFDLKLTLDLVQKLERCGGSLFKIADMLVQKELGLGDILKILMVAYNEAGCGLSESDLARFLMTAIKIPPALVLSDLLVAILDPLHRMGAVREDTTA